MNGSVFTLLLSMPTSHAQGLIVPQEELDHFQPPENIPFMAHTPQSLPPEVVSTVQRLDRRRNLAEEEHVLNRVKGMLDMSIPVKFDLLKGYLTYCGIQKVDMLMEVIQLIFEKAVLEPAFCNMYAALFSDLDQELPPFSSDEPGGRIITVRRVLLNNCQETFEGADKLSEEVQQMTGPDQEREKRDKERIVKLRALGSICLIGELLHHRMTTINVAHHIVQKLLGPDNTSCPAEENIEALCQLFHAIWKQPDESPRLQHIKNLHFSRFKDLSSNPDLAPSLRLMVEDVLFLQASKFESHAESPIVPQDELDHLQAPENIPFMTHMTQSLPPEVVSTVEQLVRRGNLVEKEHVLNRVKEMLDMSTPVKFDLLKGYLTDCGIQKVDMLMEVIQLIFEKAVLEPAFCNMYAVLFSDLHQELSPLSSDEPGGKLITVKKVLLNNCQKTFEGADKLSEEVQQMTGPDQEREQRDKERIVKLRALGNICLIGELLHQKMITTGIVCEIVQKLLGPDNTSCPAEENIEVLCQLFHAIWKHPVGSPGLQHKKNLHFGRLKDLSTNPDLAPSLRLMVEDVLFLQTAPSNIRGRGWGRGRGRLGSRGRSQRPNAIQRYSQHPQQHTTTSNRSSYNQRRPPSFARPISFSRIICQICNRPGHSALQCHHRYDESYEDLPQSFATLLL